MLYLELWLRLTYLYVAQGREENKKQMGQTSRWVVTVGDRHRIVTGEWMAESEAPSPRPHSISIAIDDQHTLCLAQGWEENRKTNRLDEPVDRGGGGPF